MGTRCIEPATFPSPTTLPDALEGNLAVLRQYGLNLKVPAGELPLSGDRLQLPITAYSQRQAPPGNEECVAIRCPTMPDENTIAMTRSKAGIDLQALSLDVRRVLPLKGGPNLQFKHLLPAVALWLARTPRVNRQDIGTLGIGLPELPKPGGKLGLAG